MVMATSPLSLVIERLRQLVLLRDAAEWTDEKLLEAFIHRQDEAAFEAIVRRHGGMVMGVCRRILHSHHDAEDAFQAAFLILARKAASIASRGSLASWLYGVAYKTARKAKTSIAHRRVREQEGAEMPKPETIPPVERLDLQAFLDQELNRLPEKYRALIVLCDLEGKTRKEAAAQLGCPEGTVASRLARARAQLAKRLTQRGVALSAAVLAGQESLNLASAGVPETMIVSTSKAAILYATGKVVSGVVSTQVAALAAGVIQTMMLAKLKTITLVALTLGLVTVGAGGLMSRPMAAPPFDQKSIAAVVGKPIDNAKKPAPRTDLYGDPLPDGAVTRLGTARLRHAGLSDYVFQAGGKSILTTGSDRALRFWDVSTGQQSRAVKLQGSAGPGRTVTLSPDGKTLVATDKGKLVFWEVESGKEIKSLPGPKGDYGYLYFSPDGKTLAVGRADWRVSFWDWQNGKEREIKLPVKPEPKIQFSMDSTFHGSFSPDGKWFVAGASWMQPLGVFEVATGREVLRLDCNAYTSTVSPDNKRLAVSSVRREGTREAVLRTFELSSGNKIAEFPQGHEGTYFSLAFSQDGKTLACGASDFGRVVDSTAGRVLHRLPDRPWQLAFAPDDKTLVFSDGYRLRLWDLAAGKERNDYPGSFGSSTTPAISPDGRFLAEADWMDRAISLWETKSGRLLRQFPLTGKEERYVRNLAFSADGRTLVSCQHEGLLRFWDVATGKEVRSVQLRDPNRANPQHTYFYHFHMSADFRHVSTHERMFDRGQSTRIARWEIGMGKILQEEKFPGEIREGAWSADGTTVALPIDNVLTRLDVSTGEVRFRIPGMAKGAPVASPDDRLVVASRTTGEGKEADIVVGVWEAATGKEIANVAAGVVQHVAIAPDNRSVVAADQGFLKVWDLATRKAIRRWPLPVSGIDSWGRSYVFSLRLSPDGRSAVTVLGDGTALVWDLVSPQTAAEPLVKQTNEKEIAVWWADLSDKDPARAYAAVWRLAEAPEAMVVGFLRTRLKPAAEADFKKVRQLIADLASDTFKVRESAYGQLAELGNAAVPSLREAMTKNPGLEVQRRLETLLARSQSQVRSSETLQRLRAIQVLERIDSRESRRLLAELGKGMSHSEETLEAQRALKRMLRQTAMP
jgi:RNA polymerase sigma factor (sigma-70 family)